MVDVASAKTLSEEFARPAGSIVVVAGIPFAQTGTTNLRVLQGWQNLNALFRL